MTNRKYTHRVVAFATVVVAFLFAAGCGDSGRVTLDGDSPADAPRLLWDEGVHPNGRMDIEFYRADDRDGEPARTTSLTWGEKMHIDDFPVGRWIVVVKGLNAQGAEVVYGETHPFEVSAGEDSKVKVFFGRPSSFNAIALEPADVAARVQGLARHTATPFIDVDGREKILVAGGFREGELASADAFLIDSTTATIEAFDGAMARGRLGHGAVAVSPPGRSPVVVVAGGNSEPVTSMDVFDSRTHAFRSVEVPCGPSRFAGIAPALTRRDDGALVHSGRVIFVGESLCVVDPYGERESETWPTPTGVEPEAPAVSASNVEGQLVVVGADGQVWSTSTIERGSGETVCDGSAGDLWDGAVVERSGGALFAAGSLDRFAFVGGESVTTGVPGADWSLITLDGCDIFGVVEGKSPSDGALVHPVLIDLSRAQPKTDTVKIAVTGGTPVARRGSDLLAFDDPTDNPPLWLASSEGLSPALASPRSGHAVVALSNRSTWVIGGGGDYAVESYVFGSATPAMGMATTPLARRKPVLTSMTVVDESVAAEKLMPILQNDDFLGAVFDQDTTATVYLVGSADRGVGDGLDIQGTPLADSAACTATPVLSSSKITWAAITGDPEGISLPEYVNPAENNSDAIAKAKYAISATMNGIEATALAADHEATAGPVAPLPPHESSVREDACGWRQYTRVGFDGLGVEGTAKDATYTGVNVLVWVVTGDDCSQGWYLPSDLGDLYGATETDALPSTELLSGIGCEDPSMDTYFGLPLQYENADELRETVRGLTWDPADLVVAVVGTGSFHEELPRRVRSVIDFLGDSGARIVDMTMADPEDPEEMSERIAALSDEIAARNPMQVCVPDHIVGELAAPSSFAWDGEGAFLPSFGSEDVAWSELSPIESRVHEKCRAVSAAADENGTVRIAEIPRSAVRVATDTDKHAGCSKGWTVQIDPRAVPAGASIFLQCLAK